MRAIPTANICKRGLLSSKLLVNVTEVVTNGSWVSFDPDWELFCTFEGSNQGLPSPRTAKIMDLKLRAQALDA